MWIRIYRINENNSVYLNWCCQTKFPLETLNLISMKAHLDREVIGLGIVVIILAIFALIALLSIII